MSQTRIPAEVVAAELEAAKPKGKPKDPRTVLGETLLKEVKIDRNQSVFPTGYKKAPEQIGTAGNGKLSADQWKVVVTIHLVITLPRLWAKEPPESRLRWMFDNFMHLVVVARLVASRVVNERIANLCFLHLISYIKGVQVLFEGVKLVPNHHLAIHIPKDFLGKLGPTTNWSSNVFERLNGMVQRIHTNNSFGTLFISTAHHLATI